jgi:hypothetical protein
LPPLQASKLLGLARSRFLTYPLLASKAEIQLGNIVFGRVQVFPPSPITSISVPLAREKVFVLVFAVSIGGMGTDSLESMDFQVSAPPDVVALDLMPLQLDGASRPSSLLDYGVRLASSLKPVVIASGLQENEFGWKLSKEALQSGTKRFAALLAMPPTRETATVSLQIVVRTQNTFFAQANTMTRGPDVQNLRFR